ncbi:MAG: response regulator, partial [Cyanobacteria bacterium]|nr:response regulator [Cyanobacteriota bacterium]
MPRILIIEDDHDLAERLRRSLEQQGFTADVANDGEVGLLMLKQYQYDAAILDWNMPGATGPDVAAQFRKDGGMIPLLMLTGEGEITQKERGFNSGVDDYLTKPFNIKELTLRLNAL